MRIWIASFHISDSRAFAWAAAGGVVERVIRIRAAELGTASQVLQVTFRVLAPMLMVGVNGIPVNA